METLLPFGAGSLVFWGKAGYGRNGRDMEDGLIKKWEGMAARFQELTNQLMDPSVLNQPGMIHKLNKERFKNLSRLHRWLSWAAENC